MSSVMDPPAIKCEFRNAQGDPCPLNALPGEHYCKPHLDLMQGRR